MDDPKRNAAEGAMLGALIADAAGATLEFKDVVSPPALETALAMRGGGVWRTAPGQITDDGELTLCLASALVECKSEFDSDTIAMAYSRWVNSQPFDIGNTTKKALGVPLQKRSGAGAQMKAAAKQHCAQSQSNGSLMRCTPLAVWAHRFTQEEITEACSAECSFTHPNQIVQDAYTCYITAIIYLIRHPKDRKGAWATVQSWAKKHADPETRDWLKAVEDGTKVPFSPNIGWVKIAFVHAFQHLLKGSSYLEAVRETLRGGGDTDTNGCIVGGLIGAAVGVNEIPKEMRDSVLRCDIKAGEQSGRPEWLQTAYQFRRLFASLYDFAPARFEVASRLPSPTVSPHSSPLRSLSPTRLFGGKKHADGSDTVKGTRTGTGGSPDIITQASGLATNTAMNLFALPASGSASTASKEKLRVSPPESQTMTQTKDRSSPPHSDPPSPGRKMSPDSPSTLGERRVITPPIPESISNSSSGKANALWAAGAINGGNNRDILGAGFLYRVLSLSVSTQSKVNELGYVLPELRDIAALIAAIQPDLVGLQEIEDIMWVELRMMLEDYDSHFVPYPSQREGLCILWRKQRWTMVQSSTVPLAPNRTNALAAVVSFKDTEHADDELTFVTTQLSTDAKKESFKAEESKSLMTYLGGLPAGRIIVAADLGVPVTSPIYEAFSLLANPMVSAYVEATRREVACTYYTTEKGKLTTDYIFFGSKMIRVVPRSAKFYTSNSPLPNALWPSSHFPLMCDFYNVNPR